MKKIVLICLCLTLAVAILLPTVALANTPANSAEEDIIYFLNPTAITAVGNYLFVADKIEDNRSAIHYFSLANSAPEIVNTLELTEEVTNLFANDDSLYIVTSKKVLSASITSSKLELTDTTFEIANDTSEIIDFTMYNGKEVILTSEGLYYEGGYLEYLQNTVSCVTSGNYVYYLYNNGSYADDKNPIARRTSSILNQTPSDVFHTNLNWRLYNLDAKGLFAWTGNEIAIFDEHAIYYSVEAGSQYALDLLERFDSYVIIDADMSGNLLYLLNDNHQIVIYETGNELKKIAVIGDDTVQLTVPQATNYTSFALVRSKGYPSNIVFKTIDDETSIKEIETKASEYIVIGYEGDSTHNFYYVLVRSDDGEYNFGWVKKSDDASDVYHDSKLQVVNTTWSDENVEYKTAFTSLSAVWIYDLPCSQFAPHSITQTADNRIEVTILQKFEEIADEGTITWYYVSYQQGETIEKGFVKKESVGSLILTPQNTEVIAYRKINTPLFSSIRVYMFGDRERMTDEYIASYAIQTLDENGEKVTTYETIPPLHSGQKVSVISEENGIALIQIQRSDGAVGYGYVYSNQLIGRDAITTNVAFGISFVAVAVVLATVLVVVFVQRKKKKTSKQ